MVLRILITALNLLCYLSRDLCVSVCTSVLFANDGADNNEDM